MGKRSRHSTQTHSPAESVATVFESGTNRELAQTRVRGSRLHPLNPDRPSPWPQSATQSLALLLPWNLFNLIVAVLYTTCQRFIAFVFAPPRLPKGAKVGQPRGRIAIIGGGLTGVSSAAHAIGHGFDVALFDEKDKLGGIWADVNRTSGLQLNSVLYRFFPSVNWSESYPKRDEILGEIRKISAEYGLDTRTHLGVKVTSVKRDPASSKDPHKHGHARWIINDDEERYGVFDAILVNVGTCGAPKMIELDGSDKFRGQIVHSSQLDDVAMEGKRVVIVGSGASGIEAAELAVAKGAASAQMLARDDKWIIPRRFLVGTALALQPLGRETWLSWIPEQLLRYLFYRDLKDLSPPRKGIYEGTPCLNSEFFQHVRAGKAEYLRGDTLGLTTNGVRFNKRTRQSKPGDDGEEVELQADVVVMATGFERPSVDFLPKNLFPEGEAGPYTRPNLYLGQFAVTDWSVLLTNSAFVDAIGTVGHVHIGMYARILMLFLAHPETRPLPQDCKTWVDAIRWFKTSSGSKQFDFFTYMELTIWISTWALLAPSTRLRHIPFVLFGFGMPARYVKAA